MLVSPRASRRLCTGLTIQLIRGSRRIWNINIQGKSYTSTQETHRFVVGINQDDLVVFVYTILIYPVRIEDS